MRPQRIFNTSGGVSKSLLKLFDYIWRSFEVTTAIPQGHLTKHFYDATGCNVSTTLKIHTALPSEIIETLFRSQYKNLQIPNKGCSIILHMHIYSSWALSRQTFQDQGELFKDCSNIMVWTLKFRAATAPLQPAAHTQIIRICSAF